MKRIISILLALALVLGFSLAATTPVAADTINVPADYPTIQLAVDNAGSGDTIIVASGNYDFFRVEGRSNITIVGEDGVTVDSANMFDGGAWWVMALVINSTNINIENIVFDGEGIHVNMLEGVTYADSTGTITGGAVRNIIGSEMAMGIAIAGSAEGSTVVGISHLTVENCTMGVVVMNAEVNLDMCSVKGRSPDGGYGIQAMDNAQVTIANCQICDCWKEDPQPGEATIGLMVAMPEDYEAMWGIVDERPCTVTMTDSIVSRNNGGICVYDDGDFTANCNNIAGNEFLGLYNGATEEVDATKNWWGDASGPSGAGPGSGDAVSFNVTFNPWLPMEFQYCPECGVCQDEPSPELGFADLIAEGKLVIAYNFDPFTTVPTAVNGWTWYDPELPPAQNNLAQLSKYTAYWVKVTEECWLTYGTKTYHFAAGWNNPVWLGC